MFFSWLDWGDGFLEKIPQRGRAFPVCRYTISMWYHWWYSPCFTRAKFLSPPPPNIVIKSQLFTFSTTWARLVPQLLLWELVTDICQFRRTSSQSLEIVRLQGLQGFCEVSPAGRVLGCIPCCAYLAMSFSCDPVGCSRQAPLSVGFSREEYWSAVPAFLLGISLAQGLGPGLPYCRWILYRRSHQGSPGCILLCHLLREWPSAAYPTSYISISSSVK